VIAMVVALAASKLRGAASSAGFVALLTSIVACVIALVELPFTVRYARYDALAILALPAGCLLAAVLVGRLRDVSMRDLALAIGLLLIPHAYAFGTYRPQWLNAQGAGMLWILAGAVLLLAATRLRGTARRALLPLGATATLASALVVVASVEHPMRQPQSLRLHTERTEVGRPGGELILSPDFAAYIRGFQRLAASGGFVENTPVLDLTGRSPGTVYAIGGTSPGTAWFLGGYERSDAFAIAALQQAPCDQIAVAWVITEPEGPNALPASVAARHGMALDRDFQDLGTVATTTAQFPTSHDQHLLKPTRTPEEARAACETARRKNPS
jgi:hypothetical protein